MPRWPNRHSCPPRFATLQCGGGFGRHAIWGFHADALTSHGVDLLAAFAFARIEISFRDLPEPSRSCHDCDRGRSTFVSRCHDLADAAGAHRLRLRDRTAELRATLEPRLFHSTDEP